MKLHNRDNVIFKEIKADCSKCSGLCCIALFFSKMDGFPQDKEAGKPCINLNKDYYCKIHGELKNCKMRGCIGYDCFGAGQHVTSVIYKGETWQTIKGKSQEIFDVFVVVFHLYQIRYFLVESRTIVLAKELWKVIDELIDENKRLCNYSPKDILNIDVDSYRDKVNIILKKVCSLIKEEYKNKKKLSGFLGGNFKNKDMSGQDLGMQLLIAANFNNCKFHGTIFLGADTRDTNLSNADLREAVFLTQGQVNCAKGNRNTKLPKHLDYPVTWE